MDAKDSEQALMFGNRLENRARHLRKWARRTGVGCYRLFDNDIPEIPLALDFYEGRLVLYLYERPYRKDETLERRWFELMARTAGERLGVPGGDIFLKERKRQRGMEQYGTLSVRGYEAIVKEDGLSFIVNLSDYLDTGLFLDHRLTRKRVRALSPGKRVLNLFSYTGSFSVYAAAGGARSVLSVDLSNTYLQWAARNAALNGLGGQRICQRREDAVACVRTLSERGEKFGLIVLDPPTFSNSKKAIGDFDVNADHPALVRRCLVLLENGGTLIFSTNSRRLKFDPAAYPGFSTRDITQETIDEDFRDRRIHRAWELRCP